MNLINRAPAYHHYAKQTGHSFDCAWVQWVVDGKYYPNPSCTCCRQVPLPPPLGWWARLKNWIRESLNL